MVTLGVILVGVAIFVAILVFGSNAQSSNRDALIGDIEYRAAAAQLYFRTPTTFAGGGYNYLGYALLPVDTGNDNGSYCVSSWEPTDPLYVPGNTAPITVSTDTIYIIGCGHEIGDDGSDPVKVYMKVVRDSLSAGVLN